MVTKSLARSEILGVSVHHISKDELVAYLCEVNLSDRPAVVLYANVHALNLACRHPWLREFYNRAEVVFCDGVGVQWGARLLGERIPQRFTPPDWMPALAERCARGGVSLYFLGARPGVAARAAEELIARFPQLEIAGTHHGFFDKDAYSQESRAVVEMVNAAKPDILILGFGMPLQERWLQENLAGLEVRAVLTGGALFDYLAGVTPRAPRWMTDHGLEWLGRLLVEPGRLWRRYLVGNPLFFWRVLKQRIAKMISDRG